MSNNPPDVVLELTKEEALMLVEHCETNIHFALSTIQKVSRQTSEKLVALIEKFQSIRQKLREQGIELDD